MYVELGAPVTPRPRKQRRLTHDPTDEELMLAYQRGDRLALRALFSRYEPMVLRILARDLDSPEEAHDLSQQAFLQLHRARADFDSGRRFRPWFLTIVLNLKREHFRRRSRRIRALGALLLRQRVHEDEARFSEPERAAEATRVRAALQELPEMQRDAIVLHWFEGLSFGEIAGMLGVSESALKVRAHRGYARLRTLLGKDVTLSEEHHTSKEERDVKAGGDR